jgi:hypothetical protein
LEIENFSQWSFTSLEADVTNRFGTDGTVAVLPKDICAGKREILYAQGNARGEGMHGVVEILTPLLGEAESAFVNLTEAQIKKKVSNAIFNNIHSNTVGRLYVTWSTHYDTNGLAIHCSAELVSLRGLKSDMTSSSLYNGKRRRGGEEPLILDCGRFFLSGQVSTGDQFTAVVKVIPKANQDFASRIKQGVQRLQ